MDFLYVVFCCCCCCCCCCCEWPELKGSYGILFMFPCEKFFFTKLCSRVKVLNQSNYRFFHQLQPWEELMNYFIFWKTNRHQRRKETVITFGKPLWCLYYLVLLRLASNWRLQHANLVDALTMVSSSSAL